MKWINNDLCIFLLVIWISCKVVMISGKQQVLCPSQTVLALAGHEVILPCLVDPPVDMNDKRIEWTSGAELESVHVHRGSPAEDEDYPVSAWSHRSTSMSDKELSKGNISLEISHVYPADEGTYHCYAPHISRESCSIQLTVVEVSVPTITVIGLADGGGLALQCEAGCWYPEPEVAWLDGAGRPLAVRHWLTMGNDPHCHVILAIVVVAAERAANLTCRARLPHHNHSYEAHSMYSPGGTSAVFLSEGAAPSEAHAPASGCGVTRTLIVCFGVLTASILLVAFCFGRRGNKQQGKQWPWLCQVELPGESLLGVSSTTELDSDVMAASSSDNPAEASDGRKKTADQVELQPVRAPAYREQTLALQSIAASMESMQGTWTHMSAVITTAAQDLAQNKAVCREEEANHK